MTVKHATDAQNRAEDATAAGPAEDARFELLDQLEECRSTSVMCAEDCQDDPERTRCAERCWDTSEVCELALRLLGRPRTDNTGLIPVLRLVVDVTRSCLVECNSHAEHHESCRRCAHVCEQSAASAGYLIETIEPQVAS